MKVYRDIREDMTAIYIAAYHQIPRANQYGSLSNPELRERAEKHAIAAKNYDPAAPARDVIDIADGIWSVVKTLLLVSFLIGVATGSGSIVILARGGLEILGDLGSIITSIVLLGPTAVAVLVAFLAVYIKLVFASPFIIQTLNGELVYNASDWSTRDGDRLVGIVLWNNSLAGGAAMRLLCIFSVLWLLSAVVPRKDPYSYIVATTSENIDAFVGVEGYIDATKRVYKRLRERDETNAGNSTSSE